MFEVGWWYRNEGGVLRCRSFWETRIDQVAIAHFENVVTCGVWVQLKLYHVSGGVWKAFFDTNNDDTYEFEYPTSGSGTNIGFLAGVPQGETARLGPSVSAYDHHIDLYYRNSAGGWVRWTNQCLWDVFDDINNYHWHETSGSEYEVHTPNSPNHSAC